LVVYLLSGDSIDEVAPKRAHTRANPEGPLTSVSDPEKIISKGKALQRQASGSAAASDSGIPIDIQSLISEKSFAEIENSKEIKNSSQAVRAEEPSFSSNITHSALEIEVSSHPQEHSSPSSLNSSPSKPSKSILHTYTNLPVLEEIIQDLSSKGEQNLALLLNQFYKASYFPSTSETAVQGEERQSFTSNSGNLSPSIISSELSIPSIVSYKLLIFIHHQDYHGWSSSFNQNGTNFGKQICPSCLAKPSVSHANW
jgi:hypothetical protein